MYIYKYISPRLTTRYHRKTRIKCYDLFYILFSLAITWLLDVECHLSGLLGVGVWALHHVLADSHHRHTVTRRMYNTEIGSCRREEVAAGIPEGNHSRLHKVARAKAVDNLHIVFVLLPHVLGSAHRETRGMQG